MPDHAVRRGHRRQGANREQHQPRPGILIGRSSQIDSGVTLAIRAVPENSVVTAPHTAQTRIRSRNAGVEEMLP